MEDILQRFSCFSSYFKPSYQKNPSDWALDIATTTALALNKSNLKWD